MQQLRAECEKQVEQIRADRIASIEQLEDLLKELENVTENLDSDLKASEARNASAVEKLRQSASKNTVVTGLQHENELLQRGRESRDAFDY